MNYKEFYKHLLKENQNVNQTWNTNVDVIFDETEKNVIFIFNQITKDLWLEEKHNLQKIVNEIKDNINEYGNLSDYEYISKKLKTDVEQGNDEEFYDDLPDHPRGLNQSKSIKYVTIVGDDIKIGENTLSLENNQNKGKLTKEIVIEIQKLLNSLDKPVDDEIENY